MQETAKIESAKGRVPYRIIAKENFDPKIHTLFGEDAGGDPSKYKGVKKADLQVDLKARGITFETDANVPVLVALLEADDKAKVEGGAA